MKKRSIRPTRLAFEPLENRLLLDGGGLLLSEFMAANDRALADADGDFSDWIEIHNPTTAAIDLGGWHLTDDAAALTKWEFPSVPLQAGGYLVVFASGKDRRVAGAELHTNFQLNADGEYLALVAPDGTTVAHAYAPEFPAQSPDISYGLTRSATAVLAEGARLSYLVPGAAEAPLSDSWMGRDFDDLEWVGNPARDSRVLITEAGTATTDYVEIQNVSSAAVNTTGWVVAANDATSNNINAVVPILWTLPAAMPAGQVLYKTDSTTDNYWGGDIFWRTVGNGWVMLVDNQGAVVDFVVWGYSTAQIAALSVTINGHQVTAARAWNGASAPGAGAADKSLQRNGGFDHNTAANWAFVTPMSKGIQNAALAAPFSSDVVASGIGFSPTPGGFGGAVHLDVGAEMRNVNASLWTRMAFTMDDPSGYSELKLLMKYNDGFVAYLNGQEIARRNAPDAVQWNSAATAERSTAASSAYEEIDISALRSLLVAGRNVLAVQGLNLTAADEDFLVLPKLVGVNDRGVPRPFTTPTPGDPNPTGFVAINEIHYNPQDNTEHGEFIELCNTAHTDLSLAGWQLGGGVQYTFPAGTVLAGGGYLVVAEDPATIQAKYGITALGPWTGKLDNEGDRVLLLNAAGQREDEVEYRTQFPWPIAADGEGSSMELVSPAQDNNLGASWRPSGYNTLTPARTPMDPAKASPTPGKQNSVWAADAPPQIRQVEHAPQQPTTTEPIVVTAKITDPDGVAQVSLLYQLVMPGNYIPAFLPLPYSTLLGNPNRPHDANPAFEDPANWTTIAMRDDGQGSDAVAGDQVYTAVIPAQATNRTIVRYRIAATDGHGLTLTAPLLDDPSLNFALYVYNGVPAYTAAQRSVHPDGAGHTYGADIMTSLPVYSLIARAEDVRVCYAYSGADQIPIDNDPARHAYNWEGAFFYDGVLYDHIDYRLRGANGRYHLAGKRNMRFRFNAGNYFQAKDDNGNPYPTKWHTLALGKNFDNRIVGNFGLTETLNSQLWDLVGVPAPYSYFTHFRVVDGAEEAPSTANGQYYGDFWGLFRAFEDYDGEFLEAHDLPQGNLYKLRDRVYDGKIVQDYQAPDAVSAAEDFNNIRFNLNSQQTVDWLLKTVNYDEWYRYHAVSEAIRHYDFPWGSEMVLKNLAWYFEPAADNPLGHVWFLPYDSDGTWGPTWNDGLDQAKNAIYDTVDPTGRGTPKPEMKLQYRNVIREFRDLVWQPEVIDPWIDRLAAVIDAFSFADRDRWNGAPGDAGSQDFGTLAAKVQDMKKFAWVGGSWPGGDVGAGGRAAVLDQLANGEGDAAAIPNTPTISYVGLPGFPSNGLVFQTTPFSDPQGNNTFGAIQWRVAEITDPGAPAYDPSEPVKFEWNAAWQSGTLTIFANRTTVPAGALHVGRTFRARVRVQDNTGRWSHWSAPVQFTTTQPDNTQALKDALRISEINYNPHALSAAEIAAGLTDNNDFEFIELWNAGTETLDIGGVQLSDGITFSFGTSQIKQLAPGGHVVVVRSLDAFQARYGSGISVAGAFSGRLSNQGERIRLSAYPGEVIADFLYDDAGAWPGRANGKGSTLELIDPMALPDAEPQRTEYLDDASHWRSSAEYGGSPGRAGVGPAHDVVINEVLSHTDPPQRDTIELYNPTPTAINVGGWYLSDATDQYKKFKIPLGTVIAAGGYLVFDEQNFNPTPLRPGPNDFALDGARGEDLYLVEADDSGNLKRFADHLEFGAAKSGESLGRWPNGAGKLYPMVSPTLDPAHGQNSGPRVGPLVISEVQYRPNAANPNDLEFVEVCNPTAQSVVLTNWRLSGGVSFDFPVGTTLAPRAAVVVVHFAATDAVKLAAFRAQYGIDASVQIVGPFAGPLNDTGGKVVLERPDSPPLDDPTFVPRVVEDEAQYAASWYPSTDGGGASLHRKGTSLWGHDVASWLAAPPTPGVVSFLPAARVAGRHIFYNRSVFDGNDAAANSQDDAAIASDKTALLPGQQAAFANYTSYNRGINGVMVDLADLPPGATLDAADFAFRVGNSDDPSTWPPAPAPTSVTVRPGAGDAGSSRVTIVWPDNAIQGQWLQITVLANARTGLAAADVFYFGNAIGESGNSPSDAIVDTADVLGARNNPRTFVELAPIDFAYDYNRDGRVNAVDLLLARNNQTDANSTLKLIHLAGRKGAKAKVREPAGELNWIADLDQPSSAKRRSIGLERNVRVVDMVLADSTAIERK